MKTLSDELQRIQDAVLPANPVQASHEYIDRYMDVAARMSAAEGKPVRCAGKGCFYCCREPVYAEREEVRYLLRQYTGDKPTLARVTLEWWNGFFAAGFDDFPHPNDMHGYAHLTKYRAAGLWCPLLKGGECTTYAERPMACRMHVATGSPKRCDDDKLREKQRFLTTDAASYVQRMGLKLLCQNAPRALFEFDHLGIWLGHFLLGKTERSKNAKDYLMTQTDRDE